MQRIPAAPCESVQGAADSSESRSALGIPRGIPNFFKFVSVMHCALFLSVNIRSSDITYTAPYCMVRQSLARGGGQNLCRKKLASTFLDPKIAKESISVIESCHRSRADALQGHFRPTSISNSQQPDHACINFCLSHSENSVQMHACMICRSEFSPEWLNQRMHGHRPARIRSGGCMTGNRKIMQK